MTCDDLVTDDRIARQPNTEPIPGYRLLAPLGQGGFGEVWKCEAPGGLLKAIKFVPGALHDLDVNAPAEEELRAIQRVKTIRHPFILSMERVERVGSELVIVLELADHNLFDLYDSERKAGKLGIARDRLLGFLREAAEALDLMNARYNLQHLDIKPQNLFLISNHVKVGDFGLVNDLPCPSTSGSFVQLGAITPVYASPEVFQGSLSPHSDQYSLAVVYQELLTGTLPFTGKNARQLMVHHLQGSPNLAPLPEADRAAVARALAKSPEERFPSCSDFIHALFAGQTEVVGASGSVVSVAPPLAPSAPRDRLDSTTRRTTRQLKAIGKYARPTRPPLSPGTAGLELVEQVSSAPLSEAWSARAVDGSPRTVKVVYGFRGEGCEPLARLTALRHPALLPLEVLQCAPGRLVFASSPPERSLRDCLQEALAQGLSGLPRPCLLADLHTTAEALDELARTHRLSHLGLSPRSLGLQAEQVVLVDFGLVALFWLPAGQAVGALNARYSAPELFAGQAGPSSDQYSLALIYHELLTGALPARPGGPSGAPCLNLLPEADRPLVARALSPDPQRRWPSCVELVLALEKAGAPGTMAVPGPAAPTKRSALPPRRASEAEALQTRFGTTLTAEVIRERLVGFREHWKGKTVSADARSLLFHMQAPQSFWQRWTGLSPTLEVHVQVVEPRSPVPFKVQARTTVRVDVRPLNGSAGQGNEALAVVGPLIVESVRKHLQVNLHGRAEERLLWNYPLEVRCVHEDGSVGAPLACHGKDVSLNGIGFYLPGELASKNVRLHLPATPNTPEMIVAARVVRTHVCAEGWYEVGAILLRDG